MNRHAYVSALRSVLQNVALPYGYTVTIWSSGQELIHLRGMPPVWVVFLYAAGAVAAITTLRAVTPEPAGDTAPQLGSTPRGGRAMLVQAASIGSAIGVVTLIGLLPSTLAWPLGGFAATGVYVVGVSIEPALREAATARR